jgi:hypothetical protein
VKRCSKNKIAHKDNSILTAVAYAAWRLSSSSMDPSSLEVRCPTQISTLSLLFKEEIKVQYCHLPL